MTLLCITSLLLAGLFLLYLLGQAFDLDAPAGTDTGDVID